VEPQRDPEEYRKDYRSYFEEFKKTARRDDEEVDDRDSRMTSHDRESRSLSLRESPVPEGNREEETTRLHQKYREDPRHPVREEYYQKNPGMRPVYRQDPYPENYRQDHYHYHRPDSHEREEVIEESQPPKRQRITFETSTEEMTPPPSSSSKLSTESRPRLVITTTNDSSEGGPSPSRKRLSLVVKINTDY